MNKWVSMGLGVGLIFGMATQGWSADADAFQFFAEEAKVVTASRRPQYIREIPMAVSVITPEEIAASGATNLWDLMRFQPGMDVMDARSADGQRAIVAVRGFPQEYVHNIQVLVDGRSVYEPISGGVYWAELPVQMQDIERIEIIRGPNAALYGSGAGLGVINIITKKPEGPTTASLEARGGNLGMAQSAGSFESSFKQFSYRLSYTQDYQHGFPLADGSGEGNDFVQTRKANARAQWSWRQGSALEFFAGGAWNKMGLEPAPLHENNYPDNFEMLKFTQKLDEHSTFEALSSRNTYIQRVTSDFPLPIIQLGVIQYDEEVLHRLDWWDNRMNTTYGIRYRNVASDGDTTFGSSPPVEELWNGYLNQSIKLPQKVTITGGASWENSNIGSGGTQANYQVATLWSPLENHSLRGSYGVAHTVPSLFTTHSNLLLSNNVHFIGDPDLTPQKITSYEVGYRGYAEDQQLELDSSLFYTVVDHIDSQVVRSITFNPDPLITIGYDTIEQAIARGVETELKYYFTRARSVYLNYTFEHISDRQGNAGGDTRNTPAHKINLGGIADLGLGFSGSINIGYKDNYFITSDSRNGSLRIPAYWRLDARLAYKLNPRTEVFIAGQNLAAPTHTEFADSLTVPRTYQGGVSIKFGGTGEP